MLRRLAVEPGYASAAWGRDVIKSYRKRVQLIHAARDEGDLHAMRALRIERLNGNRAGLLSIHLSEEARLVLTVANEDECNATILQIESQP
ncbi:type II toxin-antitoxin system RelE/ParE family toxin [Mycolicibacterium sp. BK634]|uniref:type II toxin-antitoxin system RelE/ParE family toxin n=1 Tax=Mycolicibacterium sp. BK634 TaxID=2587099 RepID=UPI00351D8E65